MGEQQNIASGFGNPATINPHGSTDELQATNDAIKEQLDALEQRYAQPNWFKIAAGFAKPQLGGFFASLGSAAEAQGENIEQQKRLAVPLAQMRSQLAIQNVQLGQRAKSDRIISDWQRQNPGQPVPPSVIQDAEAYAETPASIAARKSIENARAQETLRQTQIQNEVSRLNTLRSAGVSLTPNQIEWLQNSQSANLPQLDPNATKAVISGAGAQNASVTAPTAGTTPPAAKPVDNTPQVLPTITAPAGMSDKDRTARIEPLQTELQRLLTSPYLNDKDPEVRNRVLSDITLLTKQIQDAGGMLTTPKPNPNAWNPEDHIDSNTGKYKVTYSMPNIAGLTPEEAKLRVGNTTDDAKVAKDNAQQQVDKASVYGGNNDNFTKLETAIGGIKNRLNDPKLAPVRDQVFNILANPNNSELRRMVETAINSGFGFHSGVLNGSVNLDMDKIRKAQLNEQQQLYLQKMVGDLAIMNSMSRPMNESKTATQPGNFSLADIGQNWQVVRHLAEIAGHDLQYQREMHNAIQSGYKNTDEGSAARYHDVIQHSKEVHDANLRHGANLAAEDAAFNDVIKNLPKR
jgi:hypothetical protein